MLVVVKLLVCEIQRICTVEDMVLCGKSSKDMRVDVINIVICAREDCPIQIVLIKLVWMMYSRLHAYYMPTTRVYCGLCMTVHY
jgi:hypothetical protein